MESQTANKQITVNGVKFTINELTDISSYFEVMLLSGFIETNQTAINVNFPPHIDPFNKNGHRLIRAIRYYLDNGKFLCPYIDNDPESSRFYSVNEMNATLDYLALNEILTDDWDSEDFDHTQQEFEDVDDTDDMDVAEDSYRNYLQKCAYAEYDDLDFGFGYEDYGCQAEQYA